MSLVKSIIEFPRRMRIADIIVVAALGGIVYWLTAISQEWSGSAHSVVKIHTEFGYLPLYTVYSLTRGLVAYLISLVFTIAYGYVMAHSRAAERVMLPLLDILQSIPVLSFLPAFSIALIGLFPNTNIGLELVAVMAIFTGQVWNMTYAFYRSLKGIPSDMRDAAESFYLSRREILTKLELPASAIPLIWNSMMSFAGGWFFLTVCEAFTLGDRDFRLPGVGSYMSVAIEKGDTGAMIGAVIAMGIMIIFLDRVLWHPLVIWSRKFRMEDTAEEFEERSLVLDIIRGSSLVEWFWKKLSVKKDAERQRSAPAELETIKHSTQKLISTFTVREPKVRKAFTLMFSAAFFALIVYGAVAAVMSFATTLTTGEWADIGLGTAATFGRTLAAVLFASLWTVPVGAIIGMNQKLARRLQPVIQFMASFPAPMIFPLILIALARFHISIEIGAVLMMIIGTQWYLLFNVIAGASAIPNDLQELSDSYALPRLLRWTKVILPALFPSIITGMITAAGGAWNTSIVAENYFVPGKERMTATGIGALISIASEKGNTPLLIASTIALSTVVVLINKFFWRRLFALAQERYTLNK
ncbi:MAG: ABC transporter permease subunit [Bacteroidetes bacterium]|nr:ABC transporter permease subunit [Bacteroidota bacterium]